MSPALKLRQWVIGDELARVYGSDRTAKRA